MARRPRRPMALVLGVALAVFLLDQVSKYVVVHLLRLDRIFYIDVAAPWLSFRMAWNQGVNFGLFASGTEIARWGLVALSLAISAWVLIWTARAAARGRAGPGHRIAAGLLVGGALGNVIDRVVYGAVADFLNMSTPWFDNPYSFNVADISIFLGALGLVFFTGDGGAGPKARRPAQKPRDAR